MSKDDLVIVHDIVIPETLGSPSLTVMVNDCTFQQSARTRLRRLKPEHAVKNTMGTNGGDGGGSSTPVTPNRNYVINRPRVHVYKLINAGDLITVSKGMFRRHCSVSMHTLTRHKCCPF